MLLIACISLLLVLGKCADTGRVLSWEAKLDMYIRHIYPATRLMPPEHHTNVTVTFILKDFFFGAGEEDFSIYSWIFLKWKDCRITWDPKDYGGIKKSQISSSNIWNPMNNFRNARGTHEFDNLWTPACDVFYTGNIICVPKTIFTVLCISNISDWPYDTQACGFEFKNVGMPKAFFTFGDKRGMSMIGSEYGGTWNIIDYKQRDNNDVLYFELTLERQALGLGTMLTASAITLMLLTISLLLLDVRGSMRLPLACLSLLSHFTFLQIINYSIPQHSRNSPRILIFIRTSLVITSFTIILSLILNRMSKNSKAPPPWISGVNTWVQSTSLSYVVQSSLPAETIGESLTKIYFHEWMDFINLVNNLVTLIVAILYLTFYIMYIPSPPSLL